MTLDVDAGVTIAFPVASLPFVKGRYLGVEALVPMPLISASGAENVTITGRGTPSAGSGELKKIVLEGNALAEAAIATQESDRSGAKE